MIYDNDILLIGWSNLNQKYMISSKSIDHGVQRYRQGKSNSWANTKINGLVHINYDTIPPATRKKLPSREELIAQYYEEQRKVSQQAQTMKEVARSYIPSEIIININDQSWYSKRLADIKVNSPNLTKRCLHDYPRVSAWLRWICLQDKTSIKSYGFTNIPEFYKHIMKLINDEQLHNCKVNNYRIFQKKLKPFKEWLKADYSPHLQDTVLESIVSKKIGKATRLKMTSWHVNQLVKLARDGRQLNPVMLHQDMTILAREHKKTTVCVETIRLWINKSEIRERIASERIGKMHYMNNNQFIIDRDKASVPDALWWIDGTPEELWYVDKKNKNKLKRLEVVKVVDDYSNKIVGYAIGKENQDTVYRAVKNAVKCKGTIAYQLVSDKGPAITAIAMKEWFKLLFGSGEGYGHTPTTTGRARAKVIEPMQAHFREQMLSRDTNHSFGNITSRGGQANQDFVKANFRSFPQSEEELVAQIDRRVEMWNERPEKCTGNIPNELYDHDYDNRRRVSELLFADLFYLWLPKNKGNTYNARGISFEHSGQVYRYIAPVHITADSSDEDCKKVAVFLNENAGRKFHIKFDPDDMSKVALYYRGSFHSHAYTKLNTKRALYDTTTDTAKLLDRYRLIQSIQIQDNEAFCAANDEYIEANNMAKEPLSMARVHKNDRNDAHTEVKQVILPKRSGNNELEITKKRKNKFAI